MASPYAIKNLTHETLSKSHLDRFSTAALTRSFVASQAQHALTYAIEGKKIASRWNSGPGSEIRSSINAAAPVVETTPIGGGFSSPILKPRNPKCAELSQLYTHTPPAEKTTRNGSGSGKMLVNDENRKKDESNQGKIVKKQRSPKQDTLKLKEKRKSQNPRSQKRNLPDSDNDERNESKQYLKVGNYVKAHVLIQD